MAIDIKGTKGKIFYYFANESSFKFWAAHTGANADKNQKYKGCILKFFLGFLCANSQEKKPLPFFFKANFWEPRINKNVICNSNLFSI